MNDKQRIKEGLRVASFDIETTDLDANWGNIICVVAKPFEKDSLIFRVDDYGKYHKFKTTEERKLSEKEMLIDIIKCLNSFDLLLGWNSSQFDFPFINTRALKYKLKPPLRKYRRDLCFVSRGNLRMTNNKLKTFEVQILGKNLKTLTTPDIKEDLIRGDKKAIDFVVDHCIKDVIGTEMAYKVLMPLLGENLRKGGK